MIASTRALERLDRYLVGLQAHNPQSTADFETLFQPYLINLARRIAYQLPPDLQLEVVQQTCLDLLGNSTMKYNPRRGSAKKFLVLAVRNAFRKVRADYCPPGSPTRPRKSTAENDSSQPVVSIEELDYNVGAQSDHQEIVTRCEVDSLLKLAPERVGIAMKRIHYVGDSLSEVADDLRVSRFTLSREISAYCLRMQYVNYHVVAAEHFVC